MNQPMIKYRNMLMDNARWDGIALRPDDIVISTPPKAGTTWTQMICALLIFQTTDFPRALDAMSPWVDMISRGHADLVADVNAQRHRRFFKTHTPLDGLPRDERVTYLCVGRDPRDSGISWDNHMANIDADALMAMRAAAVAADAAAGKEPADTPDGPPPTAGQPARTQQERFVAWIDNPDPIGGLAAILHHLSVFWQARDQPNIILLHYDDLRADLGGQMRGLAARLGIEVPEDRWPDLVRAATFDHMRDHATELTPEIAIFQDAHRFFHRGTSGQWRDLLDADDLQRYRAKVESLISPELSAWVHRGPLA